MARKFLGLMLTLCILTAAVPCVRASSFIDSGQCGEDLFYTLDDEGTLTISGTGEMYTAWSAFDRPWYEERELIKSVIIEDGMTKIGHSAFYGCSNLTSIFIPDSVTMAVISFVAHCTSLEEIYIPASITYLDYTGFDGCTSLHTITVDADNQQYCSADGVVYSKDMTKICRYPEGKGGTSYSIPDSVTNLGSHAFYGCSTLVDIDISEQAESLGAEVFSGCSAMKEIYIPKNVSTISWNQLIGTSLENINVDKENTAYSSLNGVLYNKDKTILYQCPPMKSGKITVPSTVNDMRAAFLNCSNLTDIVLPNGVKTIRGGTFEGCTSLQNITLSGNIELILSGAFRDCPSLTDVYYLGTEDMWNNTEIGWDNDNLTNAAIHYNFSMPLPEACFTVTKTTEGVQVTNTSGGETVAAVIIAEYENNILKNVTSAAVTFDVDEKKTYSLSENGQYRVFVWDSLYGMQPLNK